jgi:hypothetical protein
MTRKCCKSAVHLVALLLRSVHLGLQLIEQGLGLGACKGVQGLLQRCKLQRYRKKGTRVLQGLIRGGKSFNGATLTAFVITVMCYLTGVASATSVTMVQHRAQMSQGCNRGGLSVKGPTRTTKSVMTSGKRSSRASPLSCHVITVCVTVVLRWCYGDVKWLLQEREVVQGRTLVL